MPMTLDAWMKLTGVTAAVLSRRLGVAHTSVSRWVSGKVDPSPNAMRAIWKETNGMVSPNDLLNIEQSDDRRAAA